MGGEPFDPELFKGVANVHGETDHVESTDTRVSVDMPEGVWTDVRKGQTHATGTITRPEYPGVLFDADDPSKVICWHLSRKIFTCGRINLKPQDIKIDPETGAGWCPTCFVKRKQILRKEKPRGKRAKKRFVEAMNVQIPEQNLPEIGEIVWREKEEK